MRTSAVITLVWLLAVLSACTPSPVQPSPPSSPPPPQTPAQIASLSLEGYAVAFPTTPQHRLSWPRDLYEYETRFIIRETGGQVGATIQLVSPIHPEDREDGYSYGDFCFGRTIHISAGETLETFFTDAGVKSLNCGMVTWSTNLAAQIAIEVTYADDGGHVGVLTGRLPVR